MKNKIAFVFVLLMACVCLVFVWQRKSNPSINLNLPATTNEATIAKENNLSPLRQTKLDATKVSDLNDWKNVFPEIKLLNPSPVEESWVYQNQNSHDYSSVVISGSGERSLNFATSLVDVQVSKPDNHIRRIELQAPKMTIQQIKNLGLQMCSVLQIEPKAFQAWCDAVGNVWIDKPVFSSGAGISPNDAKTIGFTVNPTFDNNCPWYMTFLFSDK
jgi:hypothetical protein